jgi:drug/metabolite transporter (DMT)-like permease
MMPIAISLLVLLGLIWGSGYSIARYAMTHGVPPLGYAFWQSLGPFIVLLIVLKLKRTKLTLRARHIGFYCVTGLLGIAIPNTNMYFTAAHLPAGLLAVLINTVPIFVYPLALICREERFSLWRLLGVLLGLIGIALLLLPKLELSHVVITPWLLQGFISPISFALCVIFIARFSPKETDATTLSVGMLFFAALILTPLTFCLGQFYNPLPPMDISKWVVILEIILSSLGYVLFFKLLNVAGPVYYSLVGAIVSLTGLCWGYILFNEHLTQAIWLALVFILAAVVCLSINLGAFRRHDTSP